MAEGAPLGAALLGALVLLAAPAFAEEPRGCDKFSWNLDQERQALSAPDLPAEESGGRRSVSPQAFALTLKPWAEGGLPTPPERAPKQPSGFAGYVDFAPPPIGGTYQVTLSAAGWIDVIQGGRHLRPTAFSGALDCPGVRKSVRFQLQAAPFTLQLSDVAAPAINVVVGPVKAAN